VIIAIRRYLKGPAFKAVLWITLFSVAGFWGLPSLFKRSLRPGAGGPAVATVNGIEITQQEYNRVTAIQQELLRRLKSQYGQYADLFIQAMGLNTDPKALALDTLIRETLINEAAESLNIKLSPKYIETKLSSPEVVQRQLTQILPTYVFDEMGNINPAALARYMAHERMTNEELNELIKNALSREFALEAVSVSSYVPQFAVRERFIHDMLKKQYSIMTIPFEPILKKEMASTVSDQEVQKFFDQQNRISKRYWTHEKRSGTMWTFDAKSFGVSVDDSEIENYYNDYKGQKFVETPMKFEARTIVFKGTDPATVDKAKRIRQELVEKPETFADKAKELSEDKETAKNGGLVPFFAKNTHDKAFEKAVFLLKNDGDISEPVVTARGLEIVQRVAKKPAVFKPLASVKQEIRDILSVRKFKEAFSDAMNSFKEDMQEDAFKTFASEHKAIQTTVSAADNDITKEAKALFGLREKGSLTSFYDGNKAIAIRLDAIQKREAPALETVKATVIEDLHRDRAQKAFRKIVKDTTAKAVETPLATLAKAVGGSVQSIDWLKLDDTKALDDLKKKKVPVDLLATLDKIGSVAYTVNPDNAHIVRLDAIEALDEGALQDSQKDIRKKLEQEYSTYFVEGFVASLYRNATIKTSESMENTAREDDYIPVEDYL
jgi:peptidyl-prolyl cis-trans isomerase D